VISSPGISQSNFTDVFEILKGFKSYDLNESDWQKRNPIDTKARTGFLERQKG